MMNASWWNIHPFVFTQFLFSFQGTTLWRVLPFRKVVGSSGLEPPTSRLSGARSNQLSYEPFSGGLSHSSPSGGDTVGFYPPHFSTLHRTVEIPSRPFLFESPFYLYAFLVEMMGFEPMTPCLQGRCSPS